MALSQQQFCVRWNSYHTNLQTVFPKLLSTENFADVTLACENRQLRCHKVVLSACSAYFERLLVQNPCKHPIIFMKDMRFSEMQSLVDFMYKGEVNVTQDDLPSLLKSAEALQIRGLCSESNGLTSAVPPPTAPGMVPATTPAGGVGSQARGGKDYTVASHALLAQLQSGAAAVQCEGLGQVHASGGEGSAVTPAVSAPPPTVLAPTTSSLAVQGLSGPALGKKRRSPSENHQAPPRLSPAQQGSGDGAILGAGGKTPRRSGNLSVDVKEETVEEDGLYYGELENDDLEYNEQDEEGAMPGGNIGAPASDFAIANVTCEYEESSSSCASGGAAAAAGGDHNYDTRDPIEPPAFIIKQVNFNNANPSSPALNQQLLEMSHQLLSGGTFTSAPVVKLVSVAPAPVVSVAPDGNTKRVRRSEVLLKQAADCVSRGQTFQNVSDQFNIPISTIRFFMARKGILPRRKRGRSSQLAPASPIEPPYHIQHYKLPDMVSLRSSNSSDSMDKNMT